MSTRPPSPELIAAEVSRIRDLLPTSLGSAELRGAIAADIRARSFFFARCSNAVALSKAKEVVDALAAGEMDKATARLAIIETMRAIGYTPEGGFPDEQGEVPPAVAGSLQDLSSQRRINFMLDTQLALVRGRGQQVRGMEPARLRQFPAYELIRSQQKAAPRLWGGQHDGTPPTRGGDVDPRPRWIIAGGKVTADGRLIALKGDPVFGELGASGNFDDALDVDYAPFAFNSGMRLREVPRGEVLALGILGPDGESVDEWLEKYHPLLMSTQVALPPPVASVKNLDPAIVDAFEKSSGIKIVEGTATMPGNEQEVREAIAKRRAEREARKAERLRASIAARKEQYAEGGAP